LFLKKKKKNFFKKRKENERKTLATSSHLADLYVLLLNILDDLQDALSVLGPLHVLGELIKLVQQLPV